MATVKISKQMPANAASICKMSRPRLFLFMALLLMVSTQSRDHFCDNNPKISP